MNWYHPVFADASVGPTIPDAAWQAVLTIIGAVIGAFVADKVARRGERRRELLVAAYEFEVIVSRLLFMVEKEKHDLASLIRANFAELERAVFKVRFYVRGNRRTGFDEQWKQYAAIQQGQLQHTSVRMVEGGGMCQDYAKACRVVSEPLIAMLDIVKQVTR